MTKRRKKGQQRDPLGQLQSEWTEEEEDDSISNIIPDGGKVRVRMTMMDSLQRAVAKDATTNKLLVDAGTDDPLALHKSGWRVSTDAAAGLNRELALAEAYEARELADREAWRSNDQDHPLSSQTRGTKPGKQKGAVCSIDGRAGHLKMVDGDLVCVVDKQDRQSVEDAYAEYDRQQSEAWRS